MVLVCGMVFGPVSVVYATGDDVEKLEIVENSEEIVSSAPDLPSEVEAMTLLTAAMGYRHVFSVLESLPFGVLSFYAAKVQTMPLVF